MGSKIIYIAIAAVILLGSAAIIVLPQIYSPGQSLSDSCISACQNYLKTGNSLDVGPCLLDPIPETDYVCDVAHSPRMQIDNMLENQCRTFNDGSVSHFIEVTPDCRFIRMV